MLRYRANVLQIRKISQHLTIHSTNSKSPINFQVDLTKVPSNFGYYSSRVNRMYNEDRLQASILDLVPSSLSSSAVITDDGNNKCKKEKSDIVNEFHGYDFDNVNLLNETLRLSEPKYTPRSPPVDRTVFAFGVFDGHGGFECSEYLKNHLFENIENINITKKSIDDLKQVYSSKISGYWKRWGRKVGEVMINECKIEGMVKKYIDAVNNEHVREQRLIKHIEAEEDRNIPIITREEIEHEESASENALISWDKFKNGSQLWTVIEMMLNDDKLSHWEIFKLRIWLGYLFTDIQFLTYENEINSKMKKKIKSKDPEDIKRRLINSGSTCTSCFTYAVDWKEGDNNHYFYQDNVVSRLLVAHVGDTRAILCDKNGIAHSLTKDHHPSNPTEATRLRKLSAGMIMTDSFGEERFLNFANTRSFGDISAKDVGITAEPEISEYLIGNSAMIENFKNNPENKEEIENNHIKDFKGDECFIVLVSDGVTNNVSDQEIVDLIMATFNNRGVDKGNPSKAAEEVIGFVECTTGDDNATCLVVRLCGWGKWPLQDRTGKLREERLNEETRHNR